MTDLDLAIAARDAANRARPCPWRDGWSAEEI